MVVSHESNLEGGKVAVVIVHYDTPRLLRCCLASLYGDPSSAIETVMVIDNASPDRTVEKLPAEFPQVEFQFNRRNLGFAAANNQGIRATREPYCLLLNPDAFIRAAAIETLVEFMETESTAGVVAPQLLNPDGSVQLSCRRFPTLRAVLLRGTHLAGLFPGPVYRYLMRDWDHGRADQVDWVIGACMMLRRAALDEVGLLDQKFFLYYEDADLCRRLGLAGWGVYYEPLARARHEHRRTSANRLPNRTTLVHLHSLVRLFRKHRLPLW